MSLSTKARTGARVTSGVAAKEAALCVAKSIIVGLAVTLAGCSSDGTTSGVTSGAPSVGIYVIQNTVATGTVAATGSILQFSTAATGASSTISTITSPASTSLEFLSVDALGDIYTTSQSAKASAIDEYNVGSTGDAPYKRSIPFDSTTDITNASALSTDDAGDIYVSNNAGQISTFSAATTGSVAPASSISITSGAGPQATAVDASGNLYVATAPSASTTPIAPIVVFAPGSTVPTRSIGGTLTTLVNGSPKALATDAAGNLYVTNVVSGVSSILIFGPDATGDTPPLRDITGSDTLLGCAGGIALDTEGYLYVVSVATCGSTANPTVLKFSTTGDGDIAPAASFTAKQWTNADAALSIAVH